MDLRRVWTNRLLQFAKWSNRAASAGRLMIAHAADGCKAVLAAPHPRVPFSVRYRVCQQFSTLGRFIEFRAWWQSTLFRPRSRSRDSL